MIYYWIDSNIWFPRLTFSMMALWSAVQTKGFVSWLCSAMKRLMASWRLAMLTKTPRFKRLRVSLAKKPSTGHCQLNGGG